MKRAIMIAVAATLWMGLAHADPGDEGGEGTDTSPPPTQHRPAAPQAHRVRAGQPASTAVHLTQQEKMRKCNGDARGLKGDERRHFMSTCLSGKSQG